MAADTPSAFDRPLETIGWAREAIVDLETSIKRFFDTARHGQVVEVDPNTGHNIYKFKIFDSLPGGLRRRATEALNNVRHSFDQSLHAACVSIGKPPRKDIHFPWRMNPTDLQRTFEKGEIPPEFWDVIRREEPYPTGQGYTGGNDTIRELSQIANRKHTVGLAITARLSGFMHPDIRGRVYYLDIPGAPAWNSVKNEFVLAIVNKEAQVSTNYQVALQVALDVPGTLRDIPLSEALCAFADKAENFAKAIRAECP